MKSRVNILNDRIVFDCNKLNLFLLIFPIYMFVSGIQLILGLVPFEEDYTGFDVFGFIFACVWTIVVGWMIFYLTFDICKKTVLDSEGITVTFLSYKKELGWQEIKDYGVSYSGKAKADGNVYDFYFATEEQVQKNNFRKKLKGNMIKILVVGEDYYVVTEKVIPFCKSKSSVNPFIGEDKFHII